MTPTAPGGPGNRPPPPREDEGWDISAVAVILAICAIAGLIIALSDSVILVNVCTTVLWVLMIPMLATAVIENRALRRPATGDAHADPLLEAALLAQLAGILAIGAAAVFLPTTEIVLLSLSLALGVLGSFRLYFWLRCKGIQRGYVSAAEIQAPAHGADDSTPDAGEEHTDATPLTAFQVLWSALDYTKQVGSIAAALVVIALALSLGTDAEAIAHHDWDHRLTSAEIRQQQALAKKQKAAAKKKREEEAAANQREEEAAAAKQREEEAAAKKREEEAARSSEIEKTRTESRCGKLKWQAGIGPRIAREVEEVFAGEGSLGRAVTGCPKTIQEQSTPDGAVYFARGEVDGHPKSLAVVSPIYKNIVVLWPAVVPTEELIREREDVHAPKTFPRYPSAGGCYYLLTSDKGSVVMLQENLGTEENSEPLVVLKPPVATAWRSTVRERGWLWVTPATHDGPLETYDLKRSLSGETVESITYSETTEEAKRPRVPRPYERRGEFMNLTELEQETPQAIK